jgi:molybdopterin-guanine dinucleotide biosynthesis adapter protein
MKAIGFVGYSNTGKTTLIEKLIPLFRERRLRVSAIKHAHHGFDMDRPGKDSWRYREAGAGQVLISTSRRWALLAETPEAPAALEDLLARLDPVDLVIVEGFRSEGAIPRIEVRRATNTEPPLFSTDPNVIAIAADHVIEPAQRQRGGTVVPLLDLNDATKIAAFVCDHLRL